MESQKMLTLFTTLAQVSFTISGLLAVAIAGDSKRRDYWFVNKSRSLFVYLTFLILLLPGFISVGGLIPLTYIIPSWVVVSFLFGLLYFLLAITMYFRKRKLADVDEFKRLEKNIFKVNSEIGLLGMGMLIASIYGGFWSYTSPSIEYPNTEGWLGLILFYATVSGAISSVIFLRASEPENLDNKDKFLSPEFTESPTRQTQKTDSGFYAVISLLIAIIAFLIGVFFKTRDN